MTGQGHDSIGIKHLGFAAQGILDFFVIDTRIATCNQQHIAFTDTKGQGLGDLAGLNAVGLGSQSYGSGTGGQLNDVQVGCFGEEKCADRFKTHQA